MTGLVQDMWPLSLVDAIEEFPIGNRGLADYLDEADEELTRLIYACRYPWDLFEIHERVLKELIDYKQQGEIHERAVIEGRCKIGKGSRVLPGVYMEGDVVIGEGCKIGPNCYIRGSTSIGDRCHIGQSVEIKNSIILDDTNVGHLSYVGDSILGRKVNFGAGTTVSNLRHDHGNHKSTVEGELIDTRRRKLGVIVGDGVHTGIGTLIYPGRKIWPAKTTRPGEVVSKDIR